MYVLETKTKFRRDIKRAKCRNRDLSLLLRAKDLLIADGKMPPEYLPHPLIGDFKNCMDAHIKPDWVLIYKVD